MNTTLTNKYINIRDKQRIKQGENKTKVKQKDEKTLTNELNWRSKLHKTWKSLWTCPKVRKELVATKGIDCERAIVGMYMWCNLNTKEQ